MTRFGPLIDIDPSCYIHETVRLYGKITLAQQVSVWPNVVMRSENFEIRIGAHSNIQDFCMIHVGYETGTYVGDYCSITHHATLHGCRIGDNCLIGINATIMDGVEIGENSTVAGHCIIRENTVIPANSIVAGVPGKVIGTRNNYVQNRHNAWYYTTNAAAYAQGRHRAWDGAEAEKAIAKRRADLEAEFKEKFEAE